VTGQTFSHQMRMQMYMARACHHQEMQLDCIPYMYMLTEVQFVVFFFLAIWQSTVFSW